MSSKHVLLQDYVTHALLSDEDLASVNIVQYRKLRLQGQIDFSTVWLTPRNGRSGLGILVEMPEFQVSSPNLPGPSSDLVISCAIIEEPNLNMEPTGGTTLAAEEAADTVLGVLHGLIIDNIGSLYADKNAIQPTEEFEGLVAYRARLRMKSIRAQKPRCAEVVVVEAAGVVTLTCATAGASLYFTQDGSFPGPSNPAAVVYDAPFAITGTELLLAAYASGFLGSNIGHLTTQ